MRILLLLLAAAALTAGAASLDWRPPREASATEQGPDAELRALRADNARLRAKMSELEQPQSAAAPTLPHEIPPELLATLTAAAARTTPHEEPSEEPPPRTPEQERADMLEYADYLDDRLASATHADDVADTLRARAHDLLGEGSELLGLACSAELCRVEIRHADRASYLAFQSQAFQQGDNRLWDGPSTFIVRDQPEAEDEPLVVALYLGRGEALPSPYQPAP